MNNFAISSGGIGEALERSASSMAAANNSLDETIALITAANTVVQDPASVGQAFKTISMRIRGAKTEMEEAGLETDGMAESTAKLRSEIMALSGVDIMLDSTTFKSTYQIMEELATKWQDLTDIQQASITELIAGKRQGNIVSSLMMNFDIAQSALQTSLDSSGSAMEEHGKYMDSIEAKLSQLKSAWQGFAQTFMNSDFLKGGIDVLKTIIDFLEKLVDNFGLLGTVGLGAGITGVVQYFRFLKNDGVETVKTITDVVNAINNITSAVSNVGNAAQTMGNVVESAGDVAEAIGDTAEAIGDTVEAVGDGAKVVGNTIETAGDVAGAVGDSAEAIGDIVEAAGDGVEAMTDLGGAATKTGGSFKAFMKTPMGVASAIGVAIAAIGLLYNAYKNAKEEAAEARQEAIESSNTYLDAASSFEQAYIKYSGRTDLTSDEEAELSSAIQGTVDALGDKSSALQGAVNSSKDYLASLEAIKKAELEAAEKAAIDKRDNASETLREAVAGWATIDGSEVGINISKNNSEAAKILSGMKSKFNIGVGDSRYNNSMYSGRIDISANASIDEMLEYYNFLSDYQKKLEENGLKDTTAYDDVDKAIGKMSEAISVYTEGVYEAVKAGYQLREGIPKTAEEYIQMREAILTDSELDSYSFSQKMSVLNSLDSQYGQLFDLSSAEAQARKFIGVIKGYGDGNGTDEVGTVETFLNMRTAVNNNECTVGEYQSKLQDVVNMTKVWSDEEQKQFNIAFGIDGDSIEKQYNDIWNYLSRNYFEKITTSDMPLDEFMKYKDKFRDMLKGLTATELQAVANIKAEIDWDNTSIEDILKQIEEEASVIEALGFEASIEIDKTSLEAFNTALEESASAMGLSEESINSLKAKYKDLAGYNPSILFEQTANGVKVNRKELAKLEKEYNDLNKSEVQEHLDTLVDKYNDVTKEIDKCANASERAKLIAERETYADKIDELATYKAQLEGVTGAYQKWIDAQNTPEDYEGYQAIATSREDIKDEISRGFLSNSTKEYIDLLSGKDLTGGTIDDYANAWKKLDQNVTGAGHSIHDFFTVNDDGDITATGIDRFFKSVQTDFKGSIAKFNEETKQWEYDFSQENLQKIQDEWGIGIEAIGLLLEAAGAAGYNVDWDGILDNLDLDTSDFETLVDSAEKAQKAFNELENVEDIDLNFNVIDVKEAETEIAKARKAYTDLITDKDGNVNLKVEGADEMRLMLSTLLIQKQQLEDSNIVMTVDTSQLYETREDVASAIDAVILFREKYKNLEIAVSTGQGIEEAKTELNNALTDLQNIGGEGIDIAAKLIFGSDGTASEFKSQVDAAISTVGNPDIKVGCKLDETAIGKLNSQLITNFTPEATVKITDIDESLVNQYKSTEKTANGKVKWENDESLVIEFQSATHEATGIVNWANNDANVAKSFSANGTVKWTSGNKVKVDVVSEANGTANAKGTAQYGRAFRHGDWGIKGSGTALVGELGMETLVRGGHFYTIGDSGAEFVKYRQGDIIFNHKQTEELFKNGKITSGGGRGKVFADGSAFASGSRPTSGRAFWGSSVSSSGINIAGLVTKPVKELTDAIKDKKPIVDYTPKASVDGLKQSSKSNSTYGGKVTGSGFASERLDNSDNDSGNKTESKFEDTIDWIETILDRAERAVSKYEKQANNVYKTWSTRNKALQDEINEVKKTTALYEDASEQYLLEAKSIGLDEDYAKKVREGLVSGKDAIEDFEGEEDEELVGKIKKYQDLYNKYLNCIDKIDELKENEASLYSQRFDNVSKEYDNLLQGFEHTESMLSEYVNQAEESGYVVSKNYYEALIGNEEDRINVLKQEQSALIKARDEAVANNEFDKYSEDWYLIMPTYLVMNM